MHRFCLDWSKLFLSLSKLHPNRRCSAILPRCMAACTVHINCHSCILDLFVILVRNSVLQGIPERKLFWVYRTKTFPFVCLCHVNFTFESPDGRCNHGSVFQKCWKSDQSFCFSWSSAECGEPISSWQQKFFSLFSFVKSFFPDYYIIHQINFV